MRTLHAVETLSRNAGGLPLAVTELAGAQAGFGGQGGEVELLSAESGDEVAIPPGVRVSRVANRFGAGRWLKAKGEPFTLLHQHGLWAPIPVAGGRFAKRAGVPLLLSPHGMLEPWAMAHHAGRKRMAWWLYQHRNLESADVLHATSEAEAGRFRDLGFTQPIAVITLGVNPIPASPLDEDASVVPPTKRRVLMLSRIHPKKGINLLLEAWANLDAPSWELVIAGNDEGGYQADLENLSSQWGLSERVRFAGPVFGPEKDTEFRRADLFVLPSFSENFGIVVPEAMQYGLPVITTTGTPWEVLERERCGWQVEATAGAIGQALENAIALSDEERNAMGERGKQVAARDHTWSGIAARYLEVYRWMTGNGERPPSIA